MKFTKLTTVLVVILIANGLILAGLSFSFTSADQAIAQMMGNGGMRYFVVE